MQRRERARRSTAPLLSRPAAGQLCAGRPRRVVRRCPADVPLRALPPCALPWPQEVSDDEEEEAKEVKEGEVEEVTPEDETKEKKVGAGRRGGLTTRGQGLSGPGRAPAGAWQAARRCGRGPWGAGSAIAAPPSAASTPASSPTATP